MRRTNKLKGMYALLIAVATMIGVTIYASCSADEDYDYYSGNELSTRAEGMMRMGGEMQDSIFLRYSIRAGSYDHERQLEDPANTTINFHMSWATNAHASLTPIDTSFTLEAIPTIKISGTFEVPKYVIECRFINGIDRQIDAGEKKFVATIQAQYREIHYNDYGIPIDTATSYLTSSTYINVDVSEYVNEVYQYYNF